MIDISQASADTENRDANPSDNTENYDVFFDAKIYVNKEFIKDTTSNFKYEAG